MLTPWFTGAYIWDYCREMILACCRDFEYLANGSVFNPTFEGGEVVQ
jgi:hypothetical protein